MGIKVIQANPIGSVIGTSAAGRLLATGQTTSYFAGDDGALEKGLPKSYTLLSTGQYSGNTNITVNAKVESLANKVAIDNVTGLMWARERCNQIGPTNDGALFWTDAVNNEHVFEYAAQANTSLLAGHGDWRVPNCVEMNTLFITEAPALFIDETVFDNIGAFSSIWSSTTDPLTTTNAIVFHFSSSGMGFKPKNTKAPTFLVRG